MLNMSRPGTSLNIAQQLRKSTQIGLVEGELQASIFYRPSAQMIRQMPFET